MALIQQNVFSQCEILSNGVIQVRMENQIANDETNPATIIATSFERHIIVPGQDYSKEDAKVQAICKAVHTSEVVAQYKAQQEANKPQV